MAIFERHQIRFWCLLLCFDSCKIKQIVVFKSENDIIGGDKGVGG